ncbi:hypothetical protein SELMODRAFT_416687 [Selaginella moellendorffii]|uniref:Uncharacterized protein n=1 Tax=Selaginella moellendorffii TaxID=88036 RepID=D8S036_SELML|nr:hypothetical protein SELMODRAFT_416687 [Selaginella moellendorffii]
MPLSLLLFQMLKRMVKLHLGVEDHRLLGEIKGLMMDREMEVDVGELLALVLKMNSGSNPDLKSKKPAFPARFGPSPSPLPPPTLGHPFVREWRSSSRAGFRSVVRGLLWRRRSVVLVGGRGGSLFGGGGGSSGDQGAPATQASTPSVAFEVAASVAEVSPEEARAKFHNLNKHYGMFMDNLDAYKSQFPKTQEAKEASDFLRSFRESHAVEEQHDIVDATMSNAALGKRVGECDDKQEEEVADDEEEEEDEDYVSKMKSCNHKEIPWRSRQYGLRQGSLYLLARGMCQIKCKVDPQESGGDAGYEKTRCNSRLPRAKFPSAKAKSENTYYRGQEERSCVALGGTAASHERSCVALLGKPRSCWITWRVSVGSFHRIAMINFK